MHTRAERARSRAAVRLLRRLRLGLVALLVVWFFSPPEIRDAVPLWLPFALALLLEVQFVAANYRSTEPFFRRDDRRPSGDDVRRYGAGTEADWAIVDVEGQPVWVDLAEPDEEEPPEGAPATAPAPARSPLRRLLRPALEAAAVLAVVAGLVVLLDRGSWDDLSAAERRAAEARISAEASAVAGKPVRVGCDTSGRRVGAVQHADGVAAVGGDRAYLTPPLCYALHRLAADGEVPSFSETARAIAVLAHEAWHLRGEQDEGVTECYAVQSGVSVGRRLGLDEDTARRMMRSQLVANQLHRRGSAEYVVPAGCVNRGPLDLRPAVDLFP
jgi:hypothetical protein